MKNSVYLRSLLLLLLSLILYSCHPHNGIDIDSSSTEGQGIHVRLQADGLFGNATSRTVYADDIEVHYLLGDEKGKLLDTYLSTYASSSQTIIIEPLPRGDYTLYVLAFSPSLKEKGLVVNEEATTLADNWFTLENTDPLTTFDEYICYGQLPFSVTTVSAIYCNLPLTHLLTSVQVEIDYASQYLEASVRSLDIGFDTSRSFFTGLSINGGYTGQVQWQDKRIPLQDRAVFQVMPTCTSDIIEGNLLLQTCTHDGFVYPSSYSFALNLTAGVQHQLRASFGTHPEARTGALWITANMLHRYPQPLILQDDEPKSVYYDRSQRSFNVNAPLQFRNLDAMKLNARFYSPCPVKNVKVWVKPILSDTEFLVAYIDSIPAFSDLEFDLPSYPFKGEFLTTSGYRVAYDRDDLLSMLSAGYTTRIESDDSYLQMISTIQPRWTIAFNSFGGDPDQLDGAPVGNWMGLRPVHAREAIAFLINFGYMISTQEFLDHLLTFQGRITNNSGDVFDVSIIPTQFKNHGGFNVGLVYAGNGVLGLGGGSTWGVYQQAYLQHYFNDYSAQIMFHELGHCLGYSHSSGMTYGPWAQECANKYYVANISTFPISSIDILDSRNNPNRY